MRIGVDGHGRLYGNTRTELTAIGQPLQVLMRDAHTRRLAIA